MEHIKHTMDGISVLAVLGTLVGALPVIAAALSIIWSILRIYESKTVQGWIRRRK